MYILGIGGQHHDASACLLDDGEVVAAAAEERFVRRKSVGIHELTGECAGLPYRSIGFCLREAGVELGDVDHVGYSFHPWVEYRRALRLRLTRAMRDPRAAAFYIARSTHVLASHMLTLDMCSRAGIPRRNIHSIRHHLAHAASSFYPSPFEEAAVLTLDFDGDSSCTELNRGRGNRLDLLERQTFPNSLGLLYAIVTRYLGFEPQSDEYKVMGLAASGTPAYLDHLRTLVHYDRKGIYSFDGACFSPTFRAPYFLRDRFLEPLGPPREPSDPVTQRHRDIAASVQALLEEVVLRLAQSLRALTGSRNLAMAGGVALNCSMNGRLLRESQFDRIWVQPAAGDDGTALGAALEVHHGILGNTKRWEQRNAYLGPAYDSAAVAASLARAKAAFTHYHEEDALLRATADLLAEGKIVGWFQGRMEWGPRALGSRSILADPTRPDMQSILNRSIKQREDFRPFAPSVTREDALSFFECDDQPDSPFMLLTYRVRREVRDRIPAVTHVDGTARIQTVDREENPRYWKLLRAFEARRGVPVLLNTSFNVMGEPIVCSPDDAIRCYAGTGFDALVLGDNLLTKSGGPATAGTPRVAGD